jgi:hypothetical protein
MHKVEPDVQMEVLIPHIARHLRNQDSALGFAPPKNLADETECVRLDTEGHVFTLVAPDLLHSRVFGPGTDWDLAR